MFSITKNIKQQHDESLASTKLKQNKQKNDSRKNGEVHIMKINPVSL